LSHYLNFINSEAADITRTTYYIHGPELMKLIFAILYVSQTMGLTPCYKMEGFLQRCMECRRSLAMRILSVRPSVFPSVKHMHCDKMEERSAQIFIPYKRSFSLVF